VIALKKEVDPKVLWLSLGVVLIAVIFIGYRMLGGPGYKANTSGGEEIQKKYKETGTFYQPPPGIVSGSGPSAPSGAMGMPPGMASGGTAGGVPGGPGGGYNLTPPSR